MEEKENNMIKEERQEKMLFQDACTIIDQAQRAAYHAVDVTLIKRNWLLGMNVKYPVFFHTVSGKFDKNPLMTGISEESKIVNAMSSQLPATINDIVNTRVHNLGRGTASRN